MQAVERGRYDVAELLVTAKPDLVYVRDKREQVAIDLLKSSTVKWSELLKQSVN